MSKLILVDGKVGKVGRKLVTNAGGAPCCCGGGGAECCDLSVSTCGLGTFNGEQDRRHRLGGLVEFSGFNYNQPTDTGWEWDCSLPISLLCNPGQLPLCKSECFLPLDTQLHCEAEDGEGGTHLADGTLYGRATFFPAGGEQWNAHKWFDNPATWRLKRRGGDRLIDPPFHVLEFKYELAVGIGSFVIAAVVVAQMSPTGRFGWSAYTNFEFGIGNGSLQITATRQVTGSCVTGVTMNLTSAVSGTYFRGDITNVQMSVLATGKPEGIGACVQRKPKDTGGGGIGSGLADDPNTSAIEGALADDPLHRCRGCGG